MKRRNCEFVTWVISFMNNKKRVGPKTEPWGTQEVTGVVVEWVPFTTTNWVRLRRKAAIQASVFPLKPQWANLCSNLVWETLSKAFEKSKRRASTSQCWFKVLARKPDCRWDKDIIFRQMFIQVAKHNMLHHLTAEARKGYASIISWVFLVWFLVDRNNHSC